MKQFLPHPPRRWLAAEVIQSSAMDCGPASLKCLVEGYGIGVSYGRLREACQTDVDGTSIDTLEEVAVQLGLEAEQVMIPADHLFVTAANALPAIVVMRLPNGNTHFVVVWRAVGNWVQVMDPATGRRWQSRQQVLDELYIHAMPVPAAAWREWAGTNEFLLPLASRMRRLGLTEANTTKLVADATADPTWQAIAALDAATRMVMAIVDAGGLPPQRAAATLLTELYRAGSSQSDGSRDRIPAVYWTVQPLTSEDTDEPMVRLRGAVLVRAIAKQAGANATASDSPVPAEEQVTAESAQTISSEQTLSPELMAALAESPVRPGVALLRMLFADGVLAPLALLFALLLAALGITLEALLFRGLIGLHTQFLHVEQRYLLFGVIMVLLVGNLLVEQLAVSSILRLGRHLELRLRMTFLEKIPRLGDRYFQSRLPSDMAERSHSIHRLRLLPSLGSGLLRACFTLLFTTIGLLWIHPAGSFIIVGAAATALVIPFFAQPMLTERDLRVRSHLGALSRFYLDSLVGLVPIRVHRAERAICREHENLLIEWINANRRFYHAVVGTEGVQALVGLGLTVWLLFDYVSGNGAIAAILLLVYWALNLPLIGQEIAQLARQYPAQRNITLRLLEPLTAPQAEEAFAFDEGVETVTRMHHETRSGNDLNHGVSIHLENVSVRAGGHEILSNIHLTIAPNEHIAIVGASGAGKSSLVGLLLGWHRVATGSLQVDGNRLDATELAKLRRMTAWVDPAIQLWNRSLLDNLRYGTHGNYLTPMATIIEQADLQSVLETLPDGMQSMLGESGGFVSGGEGQRVRLGRAMARADARLVILDEPFRGLDRHKRQTLLTKSRALWHNATLLCITHDISETAQFDRVLVLADGQIAEMGTPTALAADAQSHYSRLHKAEAELHTDVWADARWQRLQLINGRIVAGEQQTS